MMLLRCLLLLVAVALTGCTTVSDSFSDVRSRFGFQGRPSGPARVVIDVSDQHAYLYRGGTLAYSTRASTGKHGFDTPVGQFTIIEKDPDHRSSAYGAYCTPDRRIVVPDVDSRKTPKPPGTVFIGAPMPYFMRIHGGVGMHAGRVPDYPDSHGCIRLPDRAARRFFEAVTLGTPVTVKR